jgi:hypothetical protein
MQGSDLLGVAAWMVDELVRENERLHDELKKYVRLTPIL